MSSIESGVVHSVWTEPAGSGLREDVSSGSIELPVADANDFDEDGGWLSIEGEDFEYVAADKDENVITLAEVTESAYEEGTPVLVAPLAEEKWAEVQLDGEDEPIEVEVPEMFWRALPDGIRDHSRLQWVDIEEYLPDEFRICKIHGGPAPEVYEFEDSEIDFVQGLKEGSIGGDGPPSDGAPPETPLLEVAGGVGAFHVRVTPAPNPDPVIYDLYITDEDPGDPVTPDSAHLYAEDIGTSTTVRYQKEPDPDTGEPVKFAYDTDYWFYVVPREEIDGPGTATAAVSARLVPITGEDISVEYAYAGELTADQIIGGTINADVQIAGSIKTAAEGQRVEITEDGVTSYDVDGNPAVRIPTSGPALFTGDVSARVLTAREGAEFHGDANSIAANGSLTLTGGTEAPFTTPPVSDFVQSAKVEDFTRNISGWGSVTVDPARFISACPYFEDNTGNPSGILMVGQKHSKGTVFWYINPNTGAVDHSGWNRWFDNHVYGIGERPSTERLYAIHHYVPTNKWYISTWDTSGGEWHDPEGPQNFVRDSNASGYPPVACWDYEADQFVVAEHLSNGRIRVRRYDPSLGPPVADITTSASTFATGGIGGIVSGNLDFGGFRYVYAPRDRGFDIQTSFAGGVLQPTEAWASPGVVRVMAPEMSPASGNFVGYNVFTGDGQIWRFGPKPDSTVYDPDQPAEKMWAAFTWRNPSISAETTLSPKTEFIYYWRRQLRMTAPEFPSDATEWGLYLAQDSGAGPPPDHEFHLAATSTQRTVIGDLPSDIWSRSAPPTGNTFPADTPAVLRSAGDETVISGNGDVQVGKPITLHNEDWHYVGTSGEPAFNGDWKNDLVTERRLRFRKDAAGVVWILGQVSRSVPLSNGNGDARVIFTLPEAYRPVETVSGVLQFQQMTGTSTPEKFGSVTIHSDGRVQFWPENHSGGTYLSVLISYLP